jgi:hypothetical protein
MKPGTQLECQVKATLLANTSALSFFMTSFTHGFRFGLLRAAIRNQRGVINGSGPNILSGLLAAGLSLRAHRSSCARVIRG